MVYGDALLNKEFYKKLPGSLSQVQEVTLLPVPKSDWTKTETFHLDEFFAKSDQVIPIDIYFLAFHGTFGEDACKACWNLRCSIIQVVVFSPPL